MTVIDRYSRQTILHQIGASGQQKLKNSHVLLMGCGALGTVIANALVRAGIGKLRIVDRDFVETHNLQRQVLFNEQDIEEQMPKAIAAERHLRMVNSSVEVQGIVADINYLTIERFITGADLVLDGLDNFETRGLLNDICLKYRIPWVYGAVIATSGMTMDIIPGETPCLRCVRLDSSDGRNTLTCETAGVLNSVPFVIGSLQAAEAIKILIGSKDFNRDLIAIDVWENSYNSFKVRKRDDCPACMGKYEYLDARFGMKTTSLCGQNSVQILNPGLKEISFEKLAKDLSPIASVRYNKFMLRFSIGENEIVVFPDGRAIVKNTNDESVARGLYAKYIGA
jgi:molybdopterin/thiamine biosynthesis adenylyltransferase